MQFPRPETWVRDDSSSAVVQTELLQAVDFVHYSLKFGAIE
jgi:hypothetical protein